jgi:23S rRNA (cytidine1920-2'-O)/16S rRNA (cytidine1409-2'-O)-methyltransferase
MIIPMYNFLMTKERLDLLMTRKGLVESRSLAQRIIMAGEVRVNGEIIDRPSIKVDSDDTLEIKNRPQYVSRGGEKLVAALEAFKLINLGGLICADLGSSTGGFTDCLLQHGAKKVYAIDVGYGLLHWQLRNDPRIILMEKTNARFLNSLPEVIDLVTIDASFISLKTLLLVVMKWLGTNSHVIALIKPQFEAGREISGRGKVVIREPQVHKEILEGIIRFASQQGFNIKGLIKSPLIGPKGNKEFFLYLSIPSVGDANQEEIILELLNSLDNG